MYLVMKNFSKHLCINMDNTTQVKEKFVVEETHDIVHKTLK